MIRALLILFFLITSYSPPASAEAGENRSGRDYHCLPVPLENPFDSFEANEMAWEGASGLLNRGLDLAAKKFTFSASMGKRVLHLALSSYFAYAASYYSHEMAHQFPLIRGRRRFRVDFGDWSEFVPKFVVSNAAWNDLWPSDEVAEAASVSEEPWTIARMIFEVEVGLYQDEVNARSVALRAGRHGIVPIADAAAFFFTHGNAFQYILLHGDEKLRWAPYPRNLKAGLGANDINEYIDLMGRMGTFISKDDWLLVSGLSFFLSADTWNSINSMTRYLLKGSEKTKRIRIGIGGQRFIEPPNFYLFATSRGLYVRSETSVGWDADRGTKQFHILLGTGLDYLGMNRIGGVERITMGGMYSAVEVPLKKVSLKIMPYGYFDFAPGMKQVGHSIGAEVELGLWSRLAVYGKIEHNRNDMLEQVIKHKDEGVFVITGLQVKI